MVLKKIRHAISRLKLRKPIHEPAKPLVSGREVTVSLHDPYRQPDKVSHKPIKVDAPFTIEPSATREVKLVKAVHHKKIKKKSNRK